MREAGLRMMLLAIQQEAEALTGPRYERSPNRQAQRWNQEDGFVVVDGQKVPIPRRLLRCREGQEVRLGTYELFQQRRNLDDMVWWKMLRGLTTRNYPLVTRTFAEAYGIEKSATSERPRTNQRRRAGRPQASAGAPTWPICGHVFCG